jgi:hypothetical protein
MGGKKSFANKPLGSFGDKTFGENSFITKAGNAYSSIFTGGAIQGGVRNVGEGLGEITGSNALRKQAMDQQQTAEEEAKRQSDISDALARNAGGDATNIFLATGKRKKGGSGSTGAAGSSSSRDTGVQS